MNNNKIQSLKKMILTNFADLPHPGDNNIIPQGRSAAKDADWEPGKVYKYFRDKRWQDISYEHLIDNYDGPSQACLNFMTEQAVRYFLPAFLIMSLEKDQSMVSFSVILQLMPDDYSITPWPESPHKIEKLENKFAPYSLKQKQTVARALEYLSFQLNDEDAFTALECYWHRFLDKPLPQKPNKKPKPNECKR